jgi:hypothetical protein
MYKYKVCNHQSFHYHLRDVRVGECKQNANNAQVSTEEINLLPPLIPLLGFLSSTYICRPFISIGEA